MAHLPFTILNPQGRTDIVITCDHASNVVPADYGNLGLGPEDLVRHIAWDIGAAGIAQRLSQQFDCPAILCGTSRLVIDCNRHPHDPAAMPEVSDGTVVAGNQNLTEAARRTRVERFFTPYHDAIEDVIGERLTAGQRPLILSVHSMTPAMNGAFRPWEISLSSNEERSTADQMLPLLRQRSDVTVGDNQPYNMDPAEDYSTPAHALAHRLPYLQVEFRQDRVADEAGVRHWSDIFAAALGQLQQKRATT